VINARFEVPALNGPRHGLKSPTAIQVPRYGVCRPAVHVQDLEEEGGLRLFKRLAREVKLNPAELLAVRRERCASVWLPLSMNRIA